MQYELHKAAHSVYLIHLHLYLTTKYRRKIINQAIAGRITEVTTGICEKHKCAILAEGAEPDHIHFLIDLHPDNNISQLIKSIKSVTSKAIRQEFPKRFTDFYRNKRALWGRQKFVVSVGGAPLEIVKQYIENQDEPVD